MAALGGEHLVRLRVRVGVRVRVRVRVGARVGLRLGLRVRVRPSFALRWSPGRQVCAVARRSRVKNTWLGLGVGFG